MERLKDAVDRDEDRLRGFYGERVFLLGDKDWGVRRNFVAVQRAAKHLAAWADESSGGLFRPRDPPLLAGSYAEGLHLQVAGRSNGFAFLVPARYNPTLELASGSLAKEDGRPLGGCERRLPTHIFRGKGLPVFRCGTKLVVDLEALGEAHVEVHCHRQQARREGGGDEDDEDDDLDNLEECQESLNHHNLDPVQTLRDLHHHVGIALNPEYSHPLQNDPVFKQRLFPSRVPKIDQRMRDTIRLEALDLDGPAVSLTFEEGSEPVPVKLVPAILGSLKLSNQWMREDLTHLSDWWDGDLSNEKNSFLRKAAEVQRVGPELVSKGGFWRLTFSLVEATLLKDIDGDGGQRQKALRVLKFVNMTRWTPEYGNLLTSYHLKTILLWCCEIYPQTVHWGRLFNALQTLLKLLRHALAKGNLPHYFLAPVNLFNRCYKSSNTIYRSLALEILRRETEAMLADPVAYLMPQDGPQEHGANEEYEGKMVALQEFKGKNQKELEELKRMDSEHLYEEMEMLEGIEFCPKNSTSA